LQKGALLIMKKERRNRIVRGAKNRGTENWKENVSRLRHGRPGERRVKREQEKVMYIGKNYRGVFLGRGESPTGRKNQSTIDTETKKRAQKQQLEATKHV